MSEDKILNLEVSDTRLKTFLQNEIIRRFPFRTRIKFKNILRCGKQIIKSTDGREPEVQLMKAEEGHKAKFWGLYTCKNSFLCPTCSAYQMSKHAANIAAAIDALKKDGQVAFMLTLSVIHYKNLGCFDLMEILYNAWTNFSKRRSIGDRHTMARFQQEFKCVHSVKVCEFTYSDKKGWNPHFHCLFWVPKNRLQEVGEWEEQLRKSWHTCLANAWAKHYMSKEQPDDGRVRDEKFFKDFFRRLRAYGEIRAKEKIAKGDKDVDFERVQSGGLWISKNAKGKIVAQQSSQYINGWGADRELTGKPRKEASGKYSHTIHQLLESAEKGNGPHMLAIIEFAHAIKEKLRRRVMYSKGLHKVIDAWRQTKDYQEIMVKKNIQETKWKSLISFTKQQWEKILDLEVEQHLYIRHNILFLAANYNAEKAFQLIYDYLLFYGIDIKSTAENYNYWCDLAEQLFNNRIKKYDAA